MIKLKRVYEKPDKTDGKRILVDRLWPRGISKENIKLDEWMKEIAPSDELRKWFHHEEKNWKEFKKKYLKELENKKDLIAHIKSLSEKNTVTLLYSAKDEGQNQAVILKDLLVK